MNLNKNKIYSHLDRGDGICFYFDKSKNLCKIYENRPLICRVDKVYEKFFESKYSKEKYYKLNKEDCKKLKEILNLKRGL